MAEGNSKWQAFDFSDFSDVVSDSKRRWWGQDYNLRLPEKGESLIREEECDELYKPFNTFSHVTDFDSAQVILEENNLEHRKVGDNSIVNHEEYSHPLKNKKVLWFGPGQYSDDSPVERYGNVKFTMKKIKDPGGMMYEGVKFYFVEVIDYFTQSACRILVTPNVYPELRVYDPYTKGGPWYVDGAGYHYHLPKIIKGGRDYDPQKNTLEIMREENKTQDLMNNLTVSYVECKKPRKVQNKTIKTYDLEYIEPYLWRLVDDSEYFTWKEKEPFKDDRPTLLDLFSGPVDPYDMYKDDISDDTDLD